ncbi:MAG: DUF6794 domain-containing protein [Halothiobacillaceae bacterium]
MHPKQWPATIDEAAGVVIAALPAAQAAKIAAMAESELTHLHFGLGMWIRNNLGLWQGNDALMQALREREPGMHPDDASTLVIEEVWRRLREMTSKVH